MFQYIEKLRNKPDNTKRQVAFSLAFFIAGIIFVIWLSVLYPNWRNNQQKESQVLKTQPKPFSGFTANLASGFNGITAQFSKIKETISFFGAISTGTSTTDFQE